MENNFKIIPAPEFKNKIFNKKSTNNQIAEILENIITEEIKKGWEFVDIKTIIVPEKKSFLTSSREKKLSIIIFKKNTQNNSIPKVTTPRINNDNFHSLGPATKDQLTRQL